MPNDFDTKMRDFFRKREREHAKVKARCEALYWMLKRKNKLLPNKISDHSKNSSRLEVPSKVNFEWTKDGIYIVFVRITADGYKIYKWNNEHECMDPYQYKYPSQVLKHIPSID